MNKAVITKPFKRRKGVARHIDQELAKLLDDIKRQRVISGKDEPNRVKPDWRLTLAMARHPAMRDKIFADIVNADLP